MLKIAYHSTRGKMSDFSEKSDIFPRRLRPKRRIADRQGEAEDGASAGAVLGPDRSAVRVDDAAADGQSQPSAPLAARRLGAIRLGTVELLKNALVVAGRKATAAVAHFHEQCVVR